MIRYYNYVPSPSSYACGIIALEYIPVNYVPIFLFYNRGTQGPRRESDLYKDT